MSCDKGHCVYQSPVAIAQRTVRSNAQQSGNFLLSMSSIADCGQSNAVESMENELKCVWSTPQLVSTPIAAKRIIHPEEVSTVMNDVRSPVSANTDVIPITSNMMSSKILSADEIKCSREYKASCITRDIAVQKQLDADVLATSKRHTRDIQAEFVNDQAFEQVELTHTIANLSVHSVTDAEKLKLASWGLPSVVLKRYEERSITSMFEWQSECLCTGTVLAGGNLVYSAPTSAGKTMVAELLMLKCVLERKKKALFIVPYVAVAREKVLYMKGLYQDAGVSIDGFFGQCSPAGGFSSVDIAICTIERANNLFNHLLDDGKIDQIGIVVVDELHLVGDAHRGYLLELLLTKLRFLTRREARLNDQQTNPVNHIQIVGMSATLPNLDVIGHWLDADLYRTNFRPVPLTEMVKIGNKLYDHTVTTSVRTVLPTFPTLRSGNGDDGDIFQLCVETIAEGCGVLIFCPTKNWCEKLADSIAREIYGCIHSVPVQGFGNVVERLLPSNQDKLRDVVEQLRRTPVGLDSLLAKTVPCGVAFHHAGLTFDERDIIEGAFRNGSLRVLVATSTLSSGVNLPARRVIIRTPIFHGTIIDTLTYKQMIGRAGRKGVDTFGESILVCKQNEKHLAVTLACAELPPVSSCLFDSSSGSLSSSMKRAILEIVVTKVARSRNEVEAYAECTLLAALLTTHHSREGNGEKKLQKDYVVKLCITYLLDNEFITQQTGVSKDGNNVDVLLPTKLGSAIVASGLSPDDGLVVFAELQTARRCFVLENELHTVYLVTPLYMQDQWSTIDWMQYLCLWEQLPVDMKRVAELVGVQERYITRAVRTGGAARGQNQAQVRSAAIHRRFYAAMALHDLINEMPLPDVVKKYGSTRGLIQSLQQSAATFAGMVTVFCNRLGWYNMEMLLSQFQSRLSFGVQYELVDLVRISLVNSQRARAFFNAGFQTVASLANAEPTSLELILKNSAPFMSKRKVDNETDWELEERLKVRCIWLTGQKGLTEIEAAALIVQEAQKLLADDLLRMGIEWKPAESSHSNGTGAVEKKHRKTSHFSHETRKCRSFPVGQTQCGQSSISCEQKNRPVVLNMLNVRELGSISTCVPNNSHIHSCGSILVPPDCISNSMCCSVVVNMGSDQLCINEVKSSSKQCLSANRTSSLISLVKHDDDYIVNEQAVTYSIDVAENNCMNQPELRGSPALLALIEEFNSTFQQSAISREKLQIPGSGCEKMVRSAVTNADRGDSSENQLEKTVSSEVSTCNLFVDSDIDPWCSNLTDFAVNSAEEQNIQPQLTVTCDTRSEVMALSVHDDAGEARSSPEVLSTAHDDFSKMASQFLEEFSTQTFVAKGEITESVNARGEVELLMEGHKLPQSETDDLCVATELFASSAYNRLWPAEPELHICDSNSILFDENVEIHPEQENVVKCVEPVKDVLVADTMYSAQDSCACTLFYSSLHAASSTGHDGDQDDLSNHFNCKANCPIDTSQCSKVNRGAQLVSSSAAQSAEFLDGDFLSSALIENCSTEVDTMTCGNDIKMPAIVQTDFTVASSSKLPENCMESVVGAQSQCLSTKALKGSKFSKTKKTRIGSHMPCTEIVVENRNHEKKSGILATKRKTTAQQFSPARRRNKTHVLVNEFQNASSFEGDTSANDSSLYIPPTPPSISKNVCKTATPKHVVNSVSGKTHKSQLNSPETSNKKLDSKHVDSSCVIEPHVNSFVPCGGSSSVINDHQLQHQLSQSNTTDQSVSDNSTFTIIDVAADSQLFATFIAEWRTKTVFSVCVACDKASSAQQNSNKSCDGIGAKFSTGCDSHAATVAEQNRKTDGIGILVPGHDVVLVGLAICWENSDVYYVSLTSDAAGDLDGSLMAPPNDSALSVADCLLALQSVLNAADYTVTMFDAHTQLKMLSYCGVGVTLNCRDPKVACWLLDPSGHEKNFHSMVANYCPHKASLLEGISCGTGLGSLGITPAATGSGRVRACIEAVVVNSVMSHLSTKLCEADLFDLFVNVEMPSLAVLVKMELNGMGFCRDECETQKSVIQAKLSALEYRAYELAGHPFSLTSVDDVSHILFVELRLKPDGESHSNNRPASRRAAGASRHSKFHWSTARDILEKLKMQHPLPAVLLEWRRLTTILTKVVFPMQRQCLWCKHLAMNRIHGVIDLFTATGRVTMHEPNLQNIPKDIVIDLLEICAKGRDLIPIVDRARSCVSGIGSSLSNNEYPKSMSSFSISMRNCFVPFRGGVLVAADYSQLELRVIAHLSGDQKLTDILNQGGDVFKLIASQWKAVAAEAVSCEQRQQAKQICYGIIYGIGAAALAKQLDVLEDDAAVFIESFKSKFTQLRRFLSETIQACKRNGYVKTMLGRRRYLPSINNTNHHAKAHAERQAVNTTVQGSGADLVKCAMINIDAELSRRYPDTKLGHRHFFNASCLSSEVIPADDCRQQQYAERLTGYIPPRGGYFILQLHDELIYEVNADDLLDVCSIIKQNMESALKLSVKTPVKIKSGTSWGSMTEMVF